MDDAPNVCPDQHPGGGVAAAIVSRVRAPTDAIIAARPSFLMAGGIDAGAVTDDGRHREH
ncbi:hypothetical protein [uncultured Sphingomonas sp.]|uniref:hypothetical protein n=1 Tax=uncultured Sphingomonas sp. TaxID=158754 RepID=UPI0026202692|nr:hypothetical protein [uncultured Sphingomonas sp.]